MWSLWEVIKSSGCSPHEWISVLIKGNPRELSAVWGYNKKLAVCTWREARSRIWPCWHPDIGLPASELCEISHPISGSFLEQPKLRHWPLSLQRTYSPMRRQKGDYLEGCCHVIDKLCGLNLCQSNRWWQVIGSVGKLTVERISKGGSEDINLGAMDWIASSQIHTLKL